MVRTKLENGSRMGTVDVPRTVLKEPKYPRELIVEDDVIVGRVITDRLQGPQHSTGCSRK